jgi:hypothetical protein
MTADVHTRKEFAPEKTMLALFETLSLREKARKICHGLRQPIHSGDYKYARLQLQRLWSPVMAVVVPCLVLAAIMLLGAAKPQSIAGTSILYRKPEPPAPLDPSNRPTTCRL